MKDLTGSVDAFRDKLAKDGRDRAAEIRDASRSLCAGSPRGNGHLARELQEEPAGSFDRSYAHHRPAAEPPAPAAAHAKPHEAPGAAAKPAAENAVPAGAQVKAQAPGYAAKQPQSTASSSKQPAGNPDHRGPPGGQEGHSK